MIRNLRISPNGATAEVRSWKERDKWYQVVKSRDGEYRCTCPHSFIRRVECKHISEVSAEICRREFVDAKPSLFVVRFRITSRVYDAIVIAVSDEEAREKVRNMYYPMPYITQVIQTDPNRFIVRLSSCRITQEHRLMQAQKS